MWASRSKPKQGVGFTSNSRHSSSISRPFPPALPRPPAPAFGVQRRCFALLSKTLPRRWPGHPSTPHLLLFSAECRPTPHPNQSSFPLLSVCDSTAACSPSLGRSTLGPHRRPPALVRSARCGQQTRVIGRGLYVESLTAGTHEVHGHTQGKFLLIKLFPPPDSWDPPAVSSHGRKCLLVMRKKHSSR